MQLGRVSPASAGAGGICSLLLHEVWRSAFTKGPDPLEPLYFESASAPCPVCTCETLGQLLVQYIHELVNLDLVLPLLIAVLVCGVLLVLGVILGSCATLCFTRGRGFGVSSSQSTRGHLRAVQYGE